MEKKKAKFIQISKGPRLCALDEEGRVWVWNQPVGPEPDTFGYWRRLNDERKVEGE